MLSIQDLTIVCHWWPFPSSPHWVLGHVAPLEEASLPLCCPLTTPLLLPSASPFSSWTDSCSHLTAVVEFPVETGELQELEQPAGVFLAVAPLWQSHLPGLNNHHWHTKNIRRGKWIVYCDLWTKCVCIDCSKGVLGSSPKIWFSFGEKIAVAVSTFPPSQLWKPLGPIDICLHFTSKRNTFWSSQKRGEERTPDEKVRGNVVSPQQPFLDPPTFLFSLSPLPQCHNNCSILL